MTPNAVTAESRAGPREIPCASGSASWSSTRTTPLPKSAAQRFTTRPPQCAFRQTFERKRLSSDTIIAMAPHRLTVGAIGNLDSHHTRDYGCPRNLSGTTPAPKLLTVAAQPAGRPCPLPSARCHTPRLFVVIFGGTFRNSSPVERTIMETRHETKE